MLKMISKRGYIYNNIEDLNVSEIAYNYAYW